MSNDKLGLLLGEDVPTIERYENIKIKGKPVSILYSLAESLQVDKSYFLNEEGSVDL